MTEQLPAPRIQFRWERNEGEGAREPHRFQWRCHYELVLPLRDIDMRREVYRDGERVGTRDEYVVSMGGPTYQGSMHEPCRHSDGDGYYADLPFRDGAHAKWDREALGLPDLPIYAIAVDGTPILWTKPSFV